MLISALGELKDAVSYNIQKDRIEKGYVPLVNLAEYNFQKGPIKDLEKLLPDTDNAKEFLRRVQQNFLKKHFEEQKAHTEGK